MAHAPAGSPRGRGAKIADFGAKTAKFDPIAGGPDAIKKARQTRTANACRWIWRHPARAADPRQTAARTARAAGRFGPRIRRNSRRPAQKRTANWTVRTDPHGPRIPPVGLRRKEGGGRAQVLNTNKKARSRRAKYQLGSIGG